MDLIYMNSQMVDQGVLQDFEMDLAFGANENNFECRIPSTKHCCNAGDFLYIEGTEYGGTVDSIEVVSAIGDVIYYGRTWHGIIGSKVIMPLMYGEASTADVTIKDVDSNGVSYVDRYLVISGEANKCIQFMVDRLGLSSLFTASDASSGASIKNFQFDRFIDGYRGIVKMLKSVGMRLAVDYQDKKVILTAKPQYNYASDEEFDPELINMQLKKNIKSINHLVCLGYGELENRLVIHLYADQNGNISQVQTQFGMDEYTEVYDYSAIESAEELMKEGIEYLKRRWLPDEMLIKLDDSSDFYHVGDMVGATDSVTGLSANATINKKIVTIKDGLISISYEVGES
jgi:hypothetical protein